MMIMLATCHWTYHLGMVNNYTTHGDMVTWGWSTAGLPHDWEHHIELNDEFSTTRRHSQLKCCLKLSNSVAMFCPPRLHGWNDLCWLHPGLQAQLPQMFALICFAHYAAPRHVCCELCLIFQTKRDKKLSSPIQQVSCFKCCHFVIFGIFLVPNQS